MCLAEKRLAGGMTTLREQILDGLVTQDFLFSALEFYSDLEFLIKAHLSTLNAGTFKMLPISALHQKT